MPGGGLPRPHGGRYVPARAHAHHRSHDLVTLHRPDILPDGRRHTRRGAGDRAPVSGIVNVNVDPRPTSLVSQIRPPWSFSAEPPGSRR